MNIYQTFQFADEESDLAIPYMELPLYSRMDLPFIGTLHKTTEMFMVFCELRERERERTRNKYFA